MRPSVSNRMVAAIISSIILTGITGASAAWGIPMLLQAPVPGLDVAAALGDKGIAYWFLTLAAVSIASWTYIVKWLISQLESQRAAHTAATEQLISYMASDHAAVASLTASTIDALKQVTEMLAAVRGELQQNHQTHEK